MSNELLGQVAVVTGGASGMGAATVREFVKAGAKVTFIDINKDGAQKVSEETGATAVIGDVSDSTFCTNTIDEVVAPRMGGLDVLVNCAGNDSPSRCNRNQ
ncbi:MAG: SDR family NAD(P)-dependent oxidoreductase [Acidimicrobiales bacterium]